MKKTPPTSSKQNINTLTLLATTSLAVSNLFVGLMTGNTFLTAASAILAGAFAIAYSFRNRLFTRAKGAELKPERLGMGIRLPIWVLPAFLLVFLPSMIWFLQVIDVPVTIGA